MAINQYVRDRNGVNDYKKGNRTKGQPRQGKELGEFSKMLSADINRYKEMAEKYRKNRKYRQEDLAGIIERLDAYIDEQGDSEKPITVAGMIRAAGIGKHTWYEMLNGDYDYRLFQYCELHDINICSYAESAEVPVITDKDNNKIVLTTFSQALKKAMLAVEEQTEERLYSKGRVGDIFSLKAVHGWQEDNSPQTVNQTLVIASPEEAERAIKMLK